MVVTLLFYNLNRNTSMKGEHSSKTNHLSKCHAHIMNSACNADNPEIHTVAILILLKPGFTEISYSVKQLLERDTHRLSSSMHCPIRQFPLSGTSLQRVMKVYIWKKRRENYNKKYTESREN
jgi:hypothetical protein